MDNDSAFYVASNSIDTELNSFCPLIDRIPEWRDVNFRNTPAVGWLEPDLLSHRVSEVFREGTLDSLIKWISTLDDPLEVRIGTANSGIHLLRESAGLQNYKYKLVLISRRRFSGAVEYDCENKSGTMKSLSAKRYRNLPLTHKHVNTCIYFKARQPQDILFWHLCP